MNQKYSFIGKSGETYFEKDGMLANLNDEKLFNDLIKSPETINLGTGSW